MEPIGMQMLQLSVTEGGLPNITSLSGSSLGDMSEANILQDSSSLYSLLYSEHKKSLSVAIHKRNVQICGNT